MLIYYSGCPLTEWHLPGSCRLSRGVHIICGAERAADLVFAVRTHFPRLEAIIWEPYITSACSVDDALKYLEQVCSNPRHSPACGQ